MPGTDITQDPNAAAAQSAVAVDGSPDRVYVKASDDPTELGSVDAGSLQQAIAKGYRVVGADEVARIKERRALTATIPQKAEAVAEGLFRGVSGGLSDALIARIAADPDELRKIQLRAETPWAVGGQVAGTVGGIWGGSAALKGAGAVTKGLAATPVGLATRGAAALGRGAEGLVAGTSAGAGRQLLAKGAGLAVEGAADAALATVGQNISEASLGNEELTTERLLAGVQDNALLGAGLGGALGTVLGSGRFLAQTGRKGLDYAKRTKGHLLPEAAKALDDANPQKFTDYMAKASAKASGQDEATLRKAFGENWGADYLRKDEIFDDLASRNAANLDKVLGVKSMTKDAAAGSLKAQNVERLVKRGAPTRAAAEMAADDFLRATDQTLATVRTASKELRSAEAALKSAMKKKLGADEIARLRDDVANLRRAKDDALKVEEQFGRNNITELRRATGTAQEALQKAAASGDEAEYYAAFENAKRDFDRIAKRAKSAKLLGSGDTLTKRQAEATLEYAQGEADRLRGFLENVDVWGGAGRNQARRNAALTRVINTGGDYDARFVRRYREAEAGTYGVEKIRKGDPDKLRNYFRRLEPDSFEHQQTLRHLDNEEELLTALIEGGEVPASRLKDAQDALTAVRAIRNDMGVAAEKASRINAIDRMIEDESKSLLGDPAIAGALAGGPIGAALGVGVNVLAKPGSTLKKIATMQAMAQKVKQVDDRIGKTIRRHLRQLSEPVKRKATDLVPTRPLRNMAKRAKTTSIALATYGKTAKERREKMREKVEQINVVAQMDPIERARVMTSVMTRGIGDQAPTVSNLAFRKHVAAVEFMRSKLPPMPKPNPLQPHLNKMMLGNADVERLARYITAIEQPLSVLDDWQRGTLTPESMEAIKAVYPLLYQDIRTKVAMELSGTTRPIPYNEQVQLQLLLDMKDMDAIGFMQRQAVRFQQEAQEQRQPPAGPPPETAQFARTHTERIAQNL